MCLNQNSLKRYMKNKFVNNIILWNASLAIEMDIDARRKADNDIAHSLFAEILGKPYSKELISARLRKVTGTIRIIIYH